MNLSKSILEDIRESVGLGRTTVDFDTDLLLHINSSIGKLNQNGVGKFLVVNDDKATWGDFIDESQTEGNKYSQMIPLFIALNTKLLFDPPPPSSVEFHTRSVDEILWRLKVAYELKG